MEMKAKEVSDLLKVIANSNRLMILCTLEEKEHTVSELNRKIDGITMSALSQHLSSLKLAGLIKCDKVGLHVYYQIKDQRILEVIRILKETYCQNESMHKVV